MKTKFETALAQLDAKFEQHLTQFMQQFAWQFKQLEPLATNQAVLKATQSNQARDIAQMMKNLSTLMNQVSSILDCLPHLNQVPSHPILVNCIGHS